jgi:ribonuclease VapC
LNAFVLDASALLAYLHDEDGADVVAEAISESAAISAANWAETLSKVAEAGVDPGELARDLEEQGLLHGLVEVVPLTAEDAILIGELRVPTKHLGLSLGDRACLALGLRVRLPILTADREWVELEGVDADLRPIR